MPIIATNSGGTAYPLIDAGNYPARCFQMIHIGTIEESYQNETKKQNKVRLSWELPTELKEFKEGEGEKPYSISKEFTLSLHEKAGLRKMLASWRGKDFTEEQAKGFDITNLIGVPCLLNVIHKLSKDGTKTYAEIGSISPMPKAMTCPPQVNDSRILSYDDFDFALFESLPDFIKDKIRASDEFKKLAHPHETQVGQEEEENDDLPF